MSGGESLIVLQNLTLRRGVKVLLQSASITLNPGEKVGLIGRNGIGKSTLFALLTRELHEDAGEFSLPAHWRLAQVSQHLPDSEDSATDFVLQGDTRLSQAREQLHAAEQSNDGMAMAEAYLALADAGEHDAKARAQALMLGLGFKTEQLEQPVNSFSGGWRMRLQLGRALMCPADLLLLDEPTNHLDLDALVWLESWLQKFAGTLLIISHDREFLDAVTRVTLELEQQKLTRYGGNYSAFETLRAQQLQLQQNAYAKQQEHIAHLEKFIQRFKAKASKAKQAQSRVKALERMEKVAAVLSSADFTFEFHSPSHLPSPMLSIQQASFGYGEKTVLQGVNRSVLAGQRIGVLGANGQGKSTLIKTLARLQAPLSGEIVEGKGLNIGYFAQQELDVLRPQDNALEHFIRLAKTTTPNAREQELRNFLGTFLFVGDMVMQPVGNFSGGEKARLVLAMLVWQRPHLLMLDEPTNHLDLLTREALSLALNSFEGTVLLVSHDRALLRSVCDEFWLVADGGVRNFEGDLEDYQRYLLDQARAYRNSPATNNAAINSVVTNTVAPSKHTEKSSFANKNLKKEIDQLEAKLAQLTTERERLENALHNTQQLEELQSYGEQLRAVMEALEQTEAQWLALAV